MARPRQVDDRIWRAADSGGGKRPRRLSRHAFRQEVANVMRFGIGPAVGAVLVSFLAGTLPAVAHTSSIPAARSARQADDLPDGDGKRILHASCTACHEL